MPQLTPKELDQIRNSMATSEDSVVIALIKAVLSGGIHKVHPELLRIITDEINARGLSDQLMNESRKRKMIKLTKRQLKRIIREEYTLLKRKGLIKENYVSADEIERFCSMLQTTEDAGDWSEWCEHYDDLVMEFRMIHDRDADNLLDRNNLGRCPPTAAMLCDALRDPAIQNHPLFDKYFMMLYGE